MKKFFKEFKEFITKGNVLDMAVGIIIGGAFTAIITALVNHILTPLLAMIPGTGDTGALQVVLRKVYEPGTTNLDLTKSVILDFGAVISAVITFLLTALVLFTVVKTVNTIRNGGVKISEQHKTMNKAEYKKLKADMKARGCTKAEIKAEIEKREAEAAAAAEAEAKRKAEEAEANKPENVLLQIRDLLAAGKTTDGMTDLQSAQEVAAAQTNSESTENAADAK